MKKGQKLYCAPIVGSKSDRGGAFYMAKYDFKFKLKVVKSYLNGEDGYSLVARRYGIPNHAQVQRWVNTYNALGKDGLKSKNKDTYWGSVLEIRILPFNQN